MDKVIGVDWKLGVTAAGSDGGENGRIFVQVKLNVKHEAQHPNQLYMELSLPDFYKFLHELERAKAAVDRVTN